MSEATIKFLKYGIRVNGGKSQRCHYSKGSYRNLPEGTITIYAKDYSGFSKELTELFDVENNSDLMTDYFEKDKIRVFPSHPLYSQVEARVSA